MAFTYSLSLESPSSSTFAPYIISFAESSLSSLLRLSKTSPPSKLLAFLPAFKCSKSAFAHSKLAFASLFAPDFASLASFSIFLFSCSISAKISSVSIISASLTGSVCPST